jgi:hypothetical protein
MRRTSSPAHIRVSSLEDQADWNAFAGAESGSLICSVHKYVFLLSPDGTLTAIDDDGQELALTITVVA